MSWFSRIEEVCAGFIERAFGNLFPSDVEPAQIARKLVATMEARTEHGAHAMIVPSRYAVYISRSDYDRLSTHRRYLEREWAALLEQVAQRVGLRFANGPASVTLRHRAGVTAGAIAIETDDAAAGASLVLRIAQGTGNDRRIAVDRTIRVGRDPTCDLAIPDRSVSRNHATIEVHEDQTLVRDGGSKNGTFVNGERVKERALRPGDVIAFGMTRVHVEQA